MMELKLIRVFERIELLKDQGRWGFRQPKNQRGVGGLAKSHWDYLLDEMVRGIGIVSVIVLITASALATSGLSRREAMEDSGRI